MKKILLGAEIQPNEKSNNQEENSKENLNIEKFINMNYNYISCIDSKKKPDIYICGKINLPAKNYRFCDIKKKEEDLKNKTEDVFKTSHVILDDLNENSNNFTESFSVNFKKTKNNLKEEINKPKLNYGDDNLMDYHETKNFEDNFKESKKKNQSYGSDADGINLIIFEFSFFKIFVILNINKISI